LIWSHASLPPIVIGRGLEMLPELPFAVATTLPSMFSVSPVAVRVHVATCQAPSLRTAGDSTALRWNAPDEFVPRNTQFR
jgi:hypothetical protein